ncbi:MAG: ImmA/IrrE family metallo-endopeptidase [Candidatus Obscuribacterales bacterium]|nr:ImmA/IrrE family metallo-endopeptidase [Cyanobacteria bacterium HKST-UBA01]MCB9467547.1 ImmA/IrrE family metallo-endopeptidase [Candidatus Obscuribacterales bacterium]
MQLNLHELTGGKNPAAGLITRDLQFSPTAAVESMATSVRDYIGIPVETQKSWSDIESALSEWRSALQRAGVFVFKDAFKEQNYSGFCLYDEEFPIIYVNNSSTKTRQIFTYFHELAHLLFHTSGIDQLHDEFIDKLTPDNKKIEILCNRFASEFLVPGSIINDTIQKYDASASTAELLANEFHVSREVIFRRFLDLNKITNSQYKAAVEEWNQQRTKGTGKGGDYYWTKLAYLGRGYVSLAISQFQQNRIDENKLADFLDTKPKNLEKLLEEQGWTF